MATEGKPSGAPPVSACIPDLCCVPDLRYGHNVCWPLPVSRSPPRSRIGFRSYQDQIHTTGGILPMRLTVIGCGHLGATHAACMAEIGHQVLGVDIDQDRVDLLCTGRAWFLEPGLDEMLARHVRSGRLRFTTSFEEAAAFASVHFLGVGTPGLPDSAGYDLSQVFGAIAALAPHLTQPALIIGKSTVPPGTTARVIGQLQGMAPAGDGVKVAWNPEFLREGHAIEDTTHPDRIVVG